MRVLLSKTWRPTLAVSLVLVAAACARQPDMVVTPGDIFGKNTIYVQAGAGIVADSQPEMEYQETINKAKGMLRAIEIAETGFE